MGKNLTHNDGDTREVLFEKFERYYYKTHKMSSVTTPICIEDCLITSNPIGGITCCYCIHNKEFNQNKEFIICSKIKQAIKK